MSSKIVLILYYSGNGNTQRMAKGIAKGISSSSTNVRVENVEKFDPALLPDYDAIVVGSPTYFSNMAWQVKKMIDESIVHYRGGKLKGKVAGVFTSAGTRHDGKDCLETLEVALGTPPQDEDGPGAYYGWMVKVLKKSKRDVRNMGRSSQRRLENKNT